MLQSWSPVVPAFSITFMTIFGEKTASKTWTALVAEATSLYRTLKQNDGWTVDVRGPSRSLHSSFVPTTAGPGAGTGDRTCHSCGLPGHLSRNCPTANIGGGRRGGLNGGRKPDIADGTGEDPFDSVYRYFRGLDDHSLEEENTESEAEFH